MQRDYQFRSARQEDIPTIRELLEESDLPSDGLKEILAHSLVAEADGQLVGAIALDPRGRSGLLRFLVVESSHQGQRLGTALSARLINAARLLGVEKLYLLTTTAEAFFAPAGYKVADLRTIPPEIRKTEQFGNMSPLNATCMVRDIRNVPIHATRDLLQAKPAFPGSRMWAVNLKHTMLTYFEMDPNSRFETHSHESEQITMVLSGILFFQIGPTVHRVLPGEVMAIPASVPHSAWTEDEAVKGVDAWSPVMEKFAPGQSDA